MLKIDAEARNWFGDYETVKILLSPKYEIFFVKTTSDPKNVTLHSRTTYTSVFWNPPSFVWLWIIDRYTAVEERHATTLMTACELHTSMYICLKANLLESETKHVLWYTDKS